MTKPALRFGYHQGVPDTAAAAWGARLIVDQDGYVDLCWDRSDCVGADLDRQALLDTLNAQFPLPIMRQVVGSKLTAREIDTRKAGEVVLFDDNGLKVVGNSNASAGYFYLAAFLVGP